MLYVDRGCAWFICNCLLKTVMLHKITTSKFVIVKFFYETNLEAANFFVKSVFLPEQNIGSEVSRQLLAEWLGHQTSG